MEVTKREILVSIIIICVALCLGLFIDSKIVDWKMRKTEKYNKALKINNDNEMFAYALKTSVGNTITYGNFNVKKGVKTEWLKNEYMFIKKVTEEYRRHYRTVCSGSGKTRTCRTEVYYSWDTMGSKESSVSTIKFSGVKFNFNDFSTYPKYRLDLSKENVLDKKVDKIKNNCIYEKIRTFGANVGDERYYYVVINKSFNGTVFGKAKDNKLISESNTLEINDGNVNDFLENNKSNSIAARIVFWIFYIVSCGFGIYAYVTQWNDYLED